MFKKLQRQIDRKKAGSQSLKYRFDLQLGTLEGLPAGCTQCRVLWARGAKVQLSRLVDVRDGIATFEQQLTQVATVYRDPRNQLEAKEYSLKVEVPSKGDTSKMMTLGKSVVNMVRYINFSASAEDVTVPIKFKVASGGTGYLKLVIHASMLKGYVPDDGMTEVSGLTGLSSMSGEVINDQDLSGFEPGSVGGSGQSSRRATATPPVPSSPRDSSAGPDPPAEVAPPKKRSSKKPAESAEHRAQAVPAPAGPSVAEQELAKRAEELAAAEAEISRLKGKLKEAKEVKKERDHLAVQVKRLERAENKEARAAQSVEMEAMQGKLGRAEERVQSLEQQNAELSARVEELQVELEQENGQHGEEASQMKEVYDSRVAGLRRQVEEEAAARAELEASFAEQLEAECAKAAERAGAKHAAAMQRAAEEMAELKLRAAEDMELLESRLLEANAEVGRLEKKTNEAQRANIQTVNEKLALERELLESASERTELEREISTLKKKSLAEGGGGKATPSREARAAPTAKDAAAEGGAPGGNEEEFMRIVSELALAKISVAEMEGERIKLKRELYKQKEKYISVASKMTKLETALYKKEQS